MRHLGSDPIEESDVGHRVGILYIRFFCSVRVMSPPTESTETCTSVKINYVETTTSRLTIESLVSCRGHLLWEKLLNSTKERYAVIR